MLDRQRISEDRIPTAKERIAVRNRMKETYLSVGDKPKIRTRTFGEAWKLYMREEQTMLDLLLAAEVKAIAEDKVKMYDVDDVLFALHTMMDVLGYTAMKAIRIFSSMEGTYVEELERKAA